MPTQEVEVDQRLEIGQQEAIQIVLMAITDPAVVKALAGCPQFIAALKSSQAFANLINGWAFTAAGSAVASGITR